MSSDSATIFKRILRQLPRDVLNRLDMRSYSRLGRRLIDEERVRRRYEPSNHDDAEGEAASYTTTAEADTIHNLDALPNLLPPEPPESEPQIYYLYPILHDLVAEGVTGVTWHDSDTQSKPEKDTNILGSFKCSKCKNGWTSKLVPITIRKYGKSKKNFEYNAVVYNQRCFRCDSLGIPKINIETYVDRVVRRLKIWKGEFVPVVMRGPVRNRKPHGRRHCEGCKIGRCKGGMGGESDSDE